MTRLGEVYILEERDGVSQLKLQGRIGTKQAEGYPITDARRKIDGR